MTTEQIPDLTVYVDQILAQLAELDVRKAALTLQLTSVRDKLKGLRRTRKSKTNGAGKKARQPRSTRSQVIARELLAVKDQGT